jgi:hypothetical protein
MITALKHKIIESEKPVGRKPVNNWKLPPADFAYGKKEKDDEFHAGASKLTMLIIFYIITEYNTYHFSYWKLGYS